MVRSRNIHVRVRWPVKECAKFPKRAERTIKLEASVRTETRILNSRISAATGHSSNGVFGYLVYTGHIVYVSRVFML